MGGRGGGGGGCALCTPSTCDGARTSSALAVTGKELVEQLLQGGVLGHDVVLAQVVAAGGAGVHLRSEGPLKASLREETERERRLASSTQIRRAGDGYGGGGC